MFTKHLRARWFHAGAAVSFGGASGERHGGALVAGISGGPAGPPYAFPPS